MYSDIIHTRDLSLASRFKREEDFANIRIDDNTHITYATHITYVTHITYNTHITYVCTHTHTYKTYIHALIFTCSYNTRARPTLGEQGQKTGGVRKYHHR